MLPEALLGFVTSVLERLGVRYFVTGSIASSYFGEPRFTRDIDIVVALPPTLVKRFCLSFPPPEFYVEPEAVHDAILRHGGQASAASAAYNRLGLTQKNQLVAFLNSL